MATTNSTAISLSSQLLTVAILTLHHQLQHNKVLKTNLPEANLVDYIVVGGGTAGCIVAGRLAEDPDTSVLLIEAGGPISVVRQMTGNINLTEDTWFYPSVPQQNAAFAYVNQQEFMPYGFGLGGSHLRGLNVYSRGNRRDYDSWSSDYGISGWSAEEVLPYFTKSENNTDLKLVKANPRMHSTKGPIEVSTIENADPFLLKWRSIVHQAGWPLSDFSDLDNQFGVSIPQVTQSKTTWARVTTASAYVEAALQMGRTNLRVQLNSLVTQILFEGKTVVGVEYLLLKSNQTKRVFAKREVILSAGPFQSPQLLMLSGIGPREHLESLGIPVLADLPAVGSRLHSHFCISLDFQLNHPEDMGWQLDLDEPNATSVANLYDFYVNAWGPLRQRPVTFTYLASGISGNVSWPDGFLDFSTAAGGFQLEYIVRRYTMRSQWRQYWRQFVGNPLHIWLTFLNFRPLSRGTVKLKSRNPRDFPLIDPAFFSNRQDLAAIVKIMSIAFEKLIESQEGRALFTYSKLPVPGCRFCADGRPLSRCSSYLACVAQTVTMSDIHDVATVPMGGANSSNQENYALDDRLRVRTLQRLRVVDASSLPAIPNAHILAAVMMVGEKGADLIKQDNLKIK